MTRAFLFSDLRDYTRFVEAQGDSAAAGLLREYRSLVRREVRRHEGAEIKTEGDSFYVVFVSPAAAIDCAVAILRAASRHSSEHPERPLRIGMGLHAGETVPFDDQFVGSAVNVGARIASKAGPGELLVSDTFRGLVRTGVSYGMTDRGPLRLKGVAERIRAWRVEWDASAGKPLEAAVAPSPGPAAPSLPLPSATPPAPPRAGDLLCPVLVGRERELDTIEAALAAAENGAGALLLVSGEAGVGKSALMRELQRRAAARSFVLLPGATLESDAGLPYAPFLSAIRAGYRDSGAAEMKRVLDRAAPDLVPLFPELGRSERDHGTASTVERHRIPVAFTTFLSHLSSAAPAVLLLEDLHWADEASLALLERLGREAPRLRLVLAATYRSDELHRLHPLMRTVAGLRRDRLARELELAPLGSAESAAVIEAAAAGDPRVTRELVEVIHGRAQGNPFFIEELLRTAVEGARPGSRPAVPASVRDAVRARLDHISGGARSTIAAASVVGDRSTFDLLRAMRGVDEATLAEELHECVAEHLLVEVDEPHAPTYGFRHALTREVVYEQMLLPERRPLHILAANALAFDPLTPPGSLAEHWRLGGDRAQAADAYARAARSALAQYAHADAVAHVERAIEMRGTPSLEDYEVMARAYLFFDPVKAREAAERGLELMSADEPALRRIRLMRIAGRARYSLGDTQGNSALAQRAWALAEKADDVARADAADWVAVTLLTAEHFQEAGAWADRALTAARASGEMAVEGSALVTLATTISEGRPVDALRLLDDAAALARRTGSADVMARAHNNSVGGAFVVELERPRLVRIERALEFARRYGVQTSWFEGFQAFHEVLALRWRSDVSLEPSEPDDLLASWTELLGILIDACRRGPRADALERSGRLAERASATGEPQWALPCLSWHGLLETWAGNDGASRAAYDSLRAHVRNAAEPDLGLVSHAMGLHAPAVLAFLHGDTEILGSAVRALEDLDGYVGDRDALDALASALGGEDVREAFERAAAVHRARGLRFTTAIHLWALASRGCVTPAWSDTVTGVTTDLRGAGADWLAERIVELVARGAARPN